MEHAPNNFEQAAGKSRTLSRKKAPASGELFVDVLSNDHGGNHSRSVLPLTPPRNTPRSNNSTPTRSGAKRRRHPPDQIAGGNLVARSGMFLKLTVLLFFVAAFDVIRVWNFIDDLDRSDALGPEVGMHHLHYKKRRENLYRHILSKQVLDQARNVAEHVLEGGRDFLASLQNDEVDSELLENAETMVPRAEADDGGEEEFVVQPLPNGGETFGVDEPIAKLLLSAGVELDEELAAQLPTWDDVVSQYGPSPIIYGLETCEPFRQAVKPEDRMTGPAGLFNTGTNLLFELLKYNCNIKEAQKYRREPRRNGMRWQAPWGKHNPPTTHRFKNVAKAWGTGVEQGDFLPVVLIKDPYHWMGSQCRHKYTTFWGHDEKHCPNLIRWRIPNKNVPSEVRVKYALNMVKYESLLDVWTKWYTEYEQQKFPILHTRFEDLLFHPEDVVKTVCDCVGGEFTNNFRFVEESAKRTVGVHKGANGLVKAMLQYGNPNKRLDGFTDRDLRYATSKMPKELMKKYGYVPPKLPASVTGGA